MSEDTNGQDAPGQQEGQDSTSCEYNGTKYANGTTIMIDGQRMRCSNGAWVNA